MTKKRPSTDKPTKESSSGGGTRKQARSDSTAGNGSNRGGGGGGSSGGDKQALPDIPDKMARSGGGGAGNSVDQNSSEHVIAMTQLKEEIASLRKKLMQKDRELLAKDKHMTDLKSKNFHSENELRTKMKDAEKYYDSKIEVLNKKVSGLLKEVAQLSKGAKRGAAALNNGGSAVTTASAAAAAKDSGGSGTDSPITN